MFGKLRWTLSTYSSRKVRLSRSSNILNGYDDCQPIISRTPVYYDKSVIFISTTIQRTIVNKTSVTQLPIKTIEVPSMGDSITEGTIVDLPVAPGDCVRADDVVVTLETDKVSVDVRAPEAGSIVEIMNEVDDVVQIGDGLFSIDTDAVEKKSDMTKQQTLSTNRDREASTSPTTTTEPLSLSSNVVTPTLPSTSPRELGVAMSEQQQYHSASAFLGRRTERRVKMSSMRQRVAARLKDAQNTAAMLTTFQEVDMSKLMEMRCNYKEVFQSKHGVKLGFMSSFVKASTAALKELAAVNAYIDDNAKEIVYRDYIDISVAIASPGGLVVPVLRNTETMSFADVERSIAMYSQKAKDGSLSLDDMTGGTFTISNGGVFGSLMGMPIINPPQSAILGMHATKLRAVVNKQGEVVSRPMMYLALTYDHRLIDGREGVAFLKNIAEKIEDPSLLLLDI